MSDCGDEHWQWLYPMAQLTISMAQLTDSMGICYFAVCMYCPDWGVVLLNRQTCDETSEKPRGGDCAVDRGLQLCKPSINEKSIGHC